MNDIVPLNENLSRLQVFVDRLDDSVYMFVRHFARSQLNNSKPNLVLSGDHRREVDRFIYTRPQND